MFTDEPSTEDLSEHARRQWTLRLHAEHRAIRQRYAPSLPPVLVRIVDRKHQYGSWDPGSRIMTISMHLIRDYAWSVVVEILKHEMAHQYVTDVLRANERHGPLFQQACQRLRVPAWAAAASGELPAELTGPAGLHAAPDTEAFRLLRRAEKLLALAESANEHEAALAMQRVREIYARHNLEHIKQAARRDYVSCLISFRRKRMDVSDALIAGILIEHFFVSTVLTRTYDAKDLCEYRALDIMGTRENVELAEYVYHFLKHRCEALWKRHRQQTGAPAAHRTDFVRGLFHGFGQKLRTPVLDPEETALVRSKDAGLETFQRHHYPHLRSARTAGGGRDAGAFQSGHAEGRSLTIHKGLHGDHGNRGRLLGSPGGG